MARDVPAEGGSGDLELGLTFVEGRGFLRLDRPVPSVVGRAVRLDMEIPGVRFPADLSGGAARFRDRRCRLRALEVIADVADLQRFLDAAPLADFGIMEPELTMDGAGLLLSAAAALGKDAASFTARVRIRRAGGRRVRVALEDVRVYGFLPVPALSLALAVFSGLGAARPAGANGDRRLAAPAPLHRVVSPHEVEIALLDLILLDLLPGRGWRLPERAHLDVTPPEISDGRVRVRCADEGLRDGAIEGDLGDRRLADVYDALLRGEAAMATASLREHVGRSPEDGELEDLWLQLLCASRATLDEADRHADGVLRRRPGAAPACLAKAAIATARGDDAAAADWFERAAAQDATAGRLGERLAAEVAAAEARARAGQPARGRETLEEILGARPQHRGALRALAARLAAEERWQDLLRVLQQRAACEQNAATKASLAADVGFLLLDRLADPARARDRFEQATRMADADPRGWEGLGRAVVRLGDAGGAQHALERARALHVARGDRAGEARCLVGLGEVARAEGRDDAAFALFMEAADKDPEIAPPLVLGAEIALARRRVADAVGFLQRALARAATPAERSDIASRLAAAYAGELADPVAARLVLEQALSQRPADIQALTQLTSLLEDQGGVAEIEPYLDRALAECREPEARLEIFRRLGELARRSGDVAGLPDNLVRRAAEAGEAGAHAAIRLGEMAVGMGSPALMERAVAALEPRLKDGDPSLPPATRSELARVLALVRDRLGDDDAALQWLRVCLEGDTSGPAAVAAWRHFVELAARRGDATATAQALVAWADDARTQEAERPRAEHLVAAAEISRERLGLAGDALALLERAVSLDPQNDAAFEALEAASSAAGDFARVAEVLGRRAEAARRPDRLRLLARLARVQEDRLRRPQDAERTYREILELSPEDTAARMGLARLAWRRGDQPAAVELFETVAAAAAGTSGAAKGGAARAEAQLRLAQWHRLTGDTATAEELLRRGLAEEPRDGAPLDVVMDVLESWGRVDDLVARLRARAEVAPPEARREILGALATAIERHGRQEEAAEVWRGILAAAPEDIGAWRGLADVCRRAGKPEELVVPLERLWQAALRAVAERRASKDVPDLEAVGYELAALYRGELARPDRAEEILRAVLAQIPGSADATAAMCDLLAEQKSWVRLDEFVSGRLRNTSSDAARARLLAFQAQARIAAGQTDAAHEALLQADMDALGAEALALRAALAEARGDAIDALATLRRLCARAGDRGEDAGPLVARLVAASLHPSVAPPLAIDVLEEALERDVGSAALADALAELYGRIPEPRARARAWRRLLERARGLSAAPRGRIHAALAGLALAEGDHATAEAELDAALRIESAPRTRADQLVTRARLRCAKNDLERGVADLEEALSLIPDHLPALVELAEISFQRRDFEQAQSLYDQIAGTRGVEEVLALDRLALRRAELAELFGDEARAESFYREVAVRDPRHLRAWEALARYAFYREDWPEAVRRLEEVVRLLAPSEIVKLRETRQRLGEIHYQMGNLGAARHHLEMVLSAEPERIEAVELLVSITLALGRHKEAAELCGQLSRLHVSPARRAECLYRQGEILREHVGDTDAANDAYLRSCDLDPTFAPTLGRLVPYFWAAGDLKSVVDLGSELIRGRGAALLGTDDVGLLVALAALMVGRDEALARDALRGAPPAIDRLAIRLAEMAGHVARNAAEDFAWVIATVRREHEAADLFSLRDELAAAVERDPAQPGALAALALVAEVVGDAATALAARAVVRFLDPGFSLPPTTARDGWPPAGEAAWARGALVEATGGVGARVMQALAAALPGCSAFAPGDVPVAPAPPPAIVERVEDLRRRLGLAVPHLTTGGAAGVAALPTRPVTLLVAEGVARFAPAELTFALARALERARNGVLVWQELAPDVRLDVTRGVAVALGAAGAIPIRPGPVGQKVAAWLAGSAAEDLPTGVARDRLIADARDLVGRSDAAAALDLAAGALDAAADRVALLACGDPEVALRFAAGETPESPETLKPAILAQRWADMRGPTRLRALAAFLFSPLRRRLTG